VVPWWRIIFEYKRFKLDEENRLKNAMVLEKEVINQKPLKEEIRKENTKEKEIMAAEIITTNVKKEPINIVLKWDKKRDIKVKPTKKVDDYEEVPEPEIIKENGEYKVIKGTPDSEIQLEIRKVDPVITIPKDLSCPEDKISEEEAIEELCCHGDAMGNLTDTFDGKMVGGDMALKVKILRNREKNIERIPFKEKKVSWGSILRQTLN
jgi:hypothetical protein